MNDLISEVYTKYDKKLVRRNIMKSLEERRVEYNQIKYKELRTTYNDMLRRMIWLLRDNPSNTLLKGQFIYLLQEKSFTLRMFRSTL